MRLKRPSQGALIFAILLFTLSLFLLPRRWFNPVRSLFGSVVTPVQKPVYRAASFLSHRWRDLTARGDLAAENRALREELFALKNHLVRLRNDLIVAEEKLRSFDALAKLPTGDKMEGLDANVIGMDASLARFSIVVDRGTRDGVEPGQAVVWRESVVGVVAEASWTSSHIILLLDPACRVAGYVVRSREQCIVEGTGDGFCRLKYVPRERDVRKDDLIVTSGVGGTFPPSFLIGQVVESTVPESGLFRQIKVMPRAPFSRLQNVLILRPLISPTDQKKESPKRIETKHKHRAPRAN